MLRQPRTRFAAVVLAAVGVAAALAACGGEAGDVQGGPPPEVSPAPVPDDLATSGESAEAIAPAGPGPADELLGSDAPAADAPQADSPEEDAVRQTILDDSTASLRDAAPRIDLEVVSSKKVRVVARAEGVDEPRLRMRAHWEAKLVGAALLTDLAERGYPRLEPDQLAIELHVVGPSGKVFDASGLPAPDPSLEFSSRTDSAVESGLRKGLTDIGAEVVSFEVIHPKQSAFAVTMRASDPRGVINQLQRPLVTDAMLEGDTKFEGFYTEVQDDAGNPVYIGWSARRSRTDSEWFAPGYEGLREGSLPPGETETE